MGGRPRTKTLPNDYEGERGIMTSHRGVPAEVESSPLSTGCYQSKEVVHGDLPARGRVVQEVHGPRDFYYITSGQLRLTVIVEWRR